MISIRRNFRCGLKRAIQSVALCVLFSLPLQLPASTSDTLSGKPNIVFILIDDLGWADLGCYGSRFYETPSLNRLASQGMRFTDAYAACAVCSPSRAAIQTGKYPARLHLTDWIPGEGNKPANNALLIPEWTKYLSTSENTLAEALGRSGYVTGCVGKWHLGGKGNIAGTEYAPEAHGFQSSIGSGSIGHPPDYFWPYEKQNTKVPGLQSGGQKGEYLTDRLTDEAVSFVRKNRDKPFFLYLAHYAVHTPLQAKQALIDKYKAKPNSDPGQKDPVYAAMIESMDESIGRVMTVLDELDLSKKTIVVFTSDNGGLWPRSTSNAPLRAGKCHAYEGGTRVPLIVRWPGTVKAGGVCSEPVSGIDFYPTLLRAASASNDAPLNATVDGVSILPLLKQTTGSLQREALYWHYPHYWQKATVRPWGSVRAGDWKLIEFYEDMHVELYNLREDLGEKNNLAIRHPEKANELRDKLHAWRKSVDAQMPTKR